MSITPPSPADPFGAAAARPAEPGARRERWPVPLFVVLTAVGLALGIAMTDGPGGAAARGKIGDGGSLIAAGNLREALARSAEVAGSDRLVDLRVSAENVQADWLITRETTRANGEPATISSVRNTYADRTGRVEVIGTDTLTPDPDPAIPYAQVPVGAPDRIRAVLEERTGIAPERVDYVLLDIGDRGWTAYLDQETHAVERLNPIFASLDGSQIEPRGPGAAP